MQWKDELESTPVNFKKIQRFNHFATIDWTKDSIEEHKRQLFLQDRLVKGPADEYDNEEFLSTTNNQNRLQQWQEALWARYPKLEQIYLDCQSWIVLALIGVVIGFIAACLNIITQWLADIKTGHCSGAMHLNKSFCCWGEEGEASCPNWVSWTGFGLTDYIAFVTISVGLASSAAYIVKHYAPSAAGSGISEIKVIVSGFVIDGFLGWSTLLIKSLGLPLAIASGLSVGKEGPSVHYAVCVGSCISHLFGHFRRSYSSSKHFLTAASAAGVAVAFGSPIGGVLFSIEEISNVFELSTMFKSYFCCLVATSVLSVMNPFRTGQLVMFEVKYDQNWHFFEIPFFIILGAFGGVYGVIVSKYNIQWVQLRQKYLKNSAMKEVVVLASLTALICYFCEFLRLDMTEGMEVLFHECGNDDGDHQTDHRLCDYDKGQFKLFVTLIYATIMRMILVVVSYGCKVPCGIFVPSMAAGATFGRAVGILVLELHRYFPSASVFSGCGDNGKCIVPGTYAFLGAGAALSGITHLRVAVVVIMFELTGALRYVVPTMIVVAATKSVSNNWPTGGGIADQMIRFNGIPYIDAKEEHLFHGKLNKDAMTTKSVALPLNKLTYGELEAILGETSFSSYPVVSSTDFPILVGMVDREKLIRGIKQNERRFRGSIPYDAICEFATAQKLEELDIPSESYSNQTISNAKGESQMIKLEAFTNFAPLIMDIDSPLETTLSIFHKVGPKIIFINDNGLFVGLITRKDVIKYEIYLHEVFEKPPPAPGIEDKAWELICKSEILFRELIKRVVGKNIAERYLRLSATEGE